MSNERLIKKYPNRRLYDTEESRYITLAEVKELVMRSVPFKVVDSQNEQDITRGILLQIIMEQEAGGSPMFTATMLERFIRFYGDTAQAAFTSFLDQNLDLFLKQQGNYPTQCRCRGKEQAVNFFLQGVDTVVGVGYCALQHLLHCTNGAIHPLEPRRIVMQKEIIELIEQSTETAMESARRIGELNQRTFEKMFQYQADLAAFYMDASARGLELITKAKGYQDLMAGQTALLRECGERNMAALREGIGQRVRRHVPGRRESRP